MSRPVATTAYQITPSDSAVFKATVGGLWIGGAGSGNLTVQMQSGISVKLAGVPVGWLPISVTQVLATGTDVTNIVGLSI